MAFNFNWSPLTADAGFYSRSLELLTTALNKSPKPPIIVDDILVNELSLGNVPPDLEILEIGDLAEDRFRGIFKMSYHGDAFLTLKTRVQANPLNTHLLTRPAFASPQPLAAATGLTIPLQITLSDIKLSAFIILVFSRQKGLTLVFRNDPLESLKVSSTFDSIPFVRDHLQKEIEGQLRILLMDELPAIIHRLSLRLWVPEYSAREDFELSQAESAKEPFVDPFASPPQDPVDSTGNALNPAEVASLSLDAGIDTQSLFSRKNLLRLATLTDSHRTLSLFTPSIRDVVFRAWAGPTERGELTGLQTPAMTPALSRTQSYSGSMSTTYTFSDNGLQSRPTLQSFGSSSYGLSMGAGRHSKAHGARKRKKRVVNLRRKPETTESELVSEDGSTFADSASVTESTSSAPSIFSSARPASSDIEIIDTEPVTPPTSPHATVRYGKAAIRAPLDTLDVLSPGAKRSLHTELDSSPPRRQELGQLSPDSRSHDSAMRARNRLSRNQDTEDLDATPRASMYLPERNSVSHTQNAAAAVKSVSEKPKPGPSAAPLSPSTAPLPNFLQFVQDSGNSSSIAEQAWMVKMASEIARRYQEERERGNLGAPHREAPPAYAQ